MANRGKTAVDAAAGLHDEAIFALLCGGGSVAEAVDKTTSILLESDATEVHDPAALMVATVVSVVCRAAGIAISIAPDQVRDTSTLAAFLEELLGRCPHDVHTYPLVDKDPKHKKLQKAYAVYFQDLTCAFQAASRLTDEEGAAELLVPWLAGLADSVARFFRHAASVALFGMVRALSQLIQQAEQAAGARSKRDQVAAENKKRSLVQRHTEIFAISLHSRIKDVAHEVRLLAFECLRDLFLSHPTLYVHNRYVRYLSIAFYDKRPEIRHVALDAVSQLVATLPDHALNIRDFLRHFSARLVEMAADIDGRVADLAIRTVALIVRSDHNAAGGERHGAPTLTDDMVDRVLASASDDRVAIRHAAGTLLKMFLRHHVSGSSEDETLTLRVEALCSMAATWHTEQGEEQIERYLIDALWSQDDSPPATITAFADFLEIALHGESADTAAIALNFMAGFIERAKRSAPLLFGPAAKDDFRGAEEHNHVRTPKGNQSAAALMEQLRTAATVAFMEKIGAILERHNDAFPVAASAARFLVHTDLAAFTGRSMSGRLQLLMATLRRVTLQEGPGASGDGPRINHVEALRRCWRVLVSSEHVQRREASQYLQDMVKQTVKQITTTTTTAGSASSPARTATPQAASVKKADDLINAWERLAWLTGVAAPAVIGDHWGLVTAAMMQHGGGAAGSGRTKAAKRGGARKSHASSQDPAEEGAGDEDDADATPIDRPALFAHILRCAVNHVMWKVVDMGDGPGALAAAWAEAASGTLPFLLRAAAVPLSAEDGASMLTVRVQASLMAADILSLPYYQATDAQQRRFVSHTITTLVCCCAKAADQQEHIRELTRGAAMLEGKTAVPARRLATLWEAHATRLSTALIRLIVFQRVADSFAPDVLSVWTRLPTKAAADMYKSLFYTVRDRVAGASGPTSDVAAAVELDTIICGIHQCLKADATPSALDALYHLASKFASLHFLMTDKYYSSVVAVVKYAVANAAPPTDDDGLHQTHPLLLHAVCPYCAKLRPADAVAIVNSLSQQPLFNGTVAVNDPATVNYIRTFVSALRRAAKMEEGPTSAARPTPGRPTPLPGDRSVPPMTTLRRATRPLDFGATTGGATARKRLRTLEQADEDETTREIMSVVHERRQQQATGKAAVAARVEAAGGWRVRPGGAEVPPLPQAAAPRPPFMPMHSAAPSQPTQHGTQASTHVAGDSEVLVATQEW